jgi:hypothetical protein
MKFSNRHIWLLAGVTIFVGICMGLMAMRDSTQTYQSNITFTYPKNWNVNFCKSGDVIKLPGTISGEYKGNKADLDILGDANIKKCTDQKAQFNIGHAAQSCELPDGSKHLKNGLYLITLSNTKDRVWNTVISQDSCMKYTLFSFTFDKQGQELGSEDLLKFGEPNVAKDLFLNSSQYKQIKVMAESIDIEIE